VRTSTRGRLRSRRGRGGSSSPRALRRRPRPIDGELGDHGALDGRSSPLPDNGIAMSSLSQADLSSRRMRCSSSGNPSCRTSCSRNSSTRSTCPRARNRSRHLAPRCRALQRVDLLLRELRCRRRLALEGLFRRRHRRLACGQIELTARRIVSLRSASAFTGFRHQHEATLAADAIAMAQARRRSSAGVQLRPRRPPTSSSVRRDRSAASRSRGPRASKETRALGAVAACSLRSSPEPAQRAASSYSFADLVHDVALVRRS
jgi:hypothetical protein